ncbi:MAG: hypothetical protein ACYS76_00390 [Planctomycetota bacterium]|jgi:hypothetical protein
MKTKKLLFYLLAGILGGCVPVMSLHPLMIRMSRTQPGNSGGPMSQRRSMS